MGGAGGVDGQTVAIGLAYGRVATQGPDGEPVESRRVAGRIGIAHDKAGDQSLGLGRRHTDPRAQPHSRPVGGQDAPAAAGSSDEDQGGVRRRRVVAQVAPQAIDGPVRQVERDDPSHHRLPG